MQVTLVPLMRVELTQEEYNLIGLALCGRLTSEQQEQAAALNKRMLEERLRVHQQHIHLARKALVSLGHTNGVPEGR